MRYATATHALIQKLHWQLLLLNCILGGLRVPDIPLVSHISFLAPATAHVNFRICVCGTGFADSSANPRFWTISNLIFPFSNVFCICSVRHWTPIILRRIEIIRIVDLNHIHLGFISVVASSFLRVRIFTTSRRRSRSQKLFRRIVSNYNVLLRNTTVTGDINASSIMIWIWVREPSVSSSAIRMFERSTQSTLSWHPVIIFGGIGCHIDILSCALGIKLLLTEIHNIVISLSFS